MRFSVIIVTKGRPASLRGALERTAHALPLDAEMIVVDGDPGRSAERVVHELGEHVPKAVVHYLATAAGMTLQRNAGIDAARGDVVVLIDDDCVVEVGLFEALAAAYQDPRVVGATGRVKQPPRARFGNSRRLRWLLLGGGRPGSMTSYGHRRPIIHVDRPCDVEYMYGPLMTARRHLAAQVRFDERLGAYSLCEDDDFSYRLSRLGRIRYEPAAVVHHRELGRRTTDQRRIDRLRVIDRAYLFRKNFPFTLRARAGFAALIFALCAHRLINREWSGFIGLLEGTLQLRRAGPVPESERPVSPTDGQVG
jgi:GT2 family glycosyltransferase